MYHVKYKHIWDKIGHFYGTTEYFVYKYNNNRTKNVTKLIYDGP